MSAAIWYLDGGTGTDGTDDFRAGSRKVGGGLLEPIDDGESKLCVGLAIVETGEADASGSA